MKKVPVSGSNLMFSCVVPNDHRLSGVAFPMHDDVVDNSEERGRTYTEMIEENIPCVNMGDLYSKLIEWGMRVTWLALSPGHDNHCMQVFLSKHDKALDLSAEMTAAVNELLAQTWGWGRIKQIHNEKALDLIIVGGTVISSGIHSENSFDFADGHVLVPEGNRRQKPAGGRHNRARRNVR